MMTSSEDPLFSFASGPPNLNPPLSSGVYLPIRRGHVRLAEDEKNVIAYYLFPNIYRVLLSKIIICVLLSMSMNDHDHIFCYRKF